MRITLIGVGLLFTCLATAEPFALTTRVVDVPEIGQVTNSVIRLAGCEFTFVQPTGWKVALNGTTRTVSWTSADFTSVMHFKVSILPGGGQTTQTEELKHVVLQELPAARIVEEFPCYTAGRNGTGVDLERVQGTGTMSSRVALIRFGEGSVRIELTTSPEQFADRQMDFSRFLNSLRIEPISIAPTDSNRRGPRP